MSRSFIFSRFVACAAVAAGCGTSDTGGPDAFDAAPGTATGDATTAAGDGGGLLFEGGTAACVPQTCGSLGYTCGKNGDGCGGTIDCGSCTAPAICGGGGYSKCGTGTAPSADGGGASTCVPATCQSLGYDCGPAADGCGGLLQCGADGGACPAPQFCGGGGFDVCGAGDGGALSSDGGPACTPATCQSLAYDCGKAGDGCGGMIDCGSCNPSEYCGGGGFDRCGGSTGLQPDGGPVAPCQPKTCADLGYDCGAAGDGCGGLLQCGTDGGTCPAPQFCGGGGFDRCGGNSGRAADGGALCRPFTCTGQGFDCGAASDGCGGLLQCGASCPGQGDICGGGGKPNVCGHTTACTGLCQQQAACDGGTPTTITGRVVSGTTGAGFGSPDPVPNVLVYVPNGTIGALTSGPSCGACAADVSGAPLVSTKTAFDGTFTLANVPVGTSIPLVIQLGRWRRCITITVGSACTTTALPYDIHMPRTQAGSTTAAAGDYPDIPGSSNIPRTAISTGAQDPIECVLRKMGVADSEFTTDTGGGRMHLYYGNGATLAGADPESSLFHTGDSGGTYAGYDQILLPCWGYAATKTASQLASLVSYANAGGRFFATHYSYTWLSGNQPFDGAATWDLNYADVASITGNVSTAVPASNPGSFAQWLGAVGALTRASPPQIQIDVVRHDVDGVAGAGVDWIDGTDTACFTRPELLHYTFDPSSCGHQIFSDFHVNVGGAYDNLNECVALGCGGTALCGGGGLFPGECSASPLTSQERVLEFMIWDLSSCAGPGTTPTCTPRTCTQQNIGCGPAGDGCGGTIAGGCGSCPAGQTCGGGGVPGQCGAPDGGTCAPQSCQEQHIACGPAGDGCGSSIPGGCGPCPAGQTCGGGGVPFQCGGGDAGTCATQTCAQQGVTCGPTGDGCGGSLDCGSCPPPQTCGGGGVPGRCGGNGGCVPRTCGAQHITCGPAGDGCGGLLQCGSCIAPQTCGGGGTPGQCGGGPTCTPTTCAQLNFNCGPAGDGCGGLLDCGPCTAPQTCGGGGIPGRCGGGTQ
jgi:hypothetical protein